MKFILLLFLSLFSVQSFGQKFTVSGHIKDSDTGEVLIGANIYNPEEKNGTTSNNFGFFSYSTFSDSINLSFSYIGYKTQKKSFFLEKNIEVIIELEPGNVLDEVTVTPTESIEKRTQMSRISIPVQQIKAMPKLLGEVDVLKSVQMLPGVQSGMEGTSGLYVRGGGPDQNLILLDGVPVYNVSHLFGFVSVFNADAINNVDLIKGGFPARYGGRLSSVLDITLKEGNTEKIKTEGSIGILSSKITIDGPINNKATFLVSGRRTFLDFLARPIIRDQTNGEYDAGYYFYDLNSKLNYKISSRNRIYLSTYLGRDSGFFFGSRTNTTVVPTNDEPEIISNFSEDETGLSWGNVTTALRWNYIFSPKMFSNATLTYSSYFFNIKDREYDSSTSNLETSIVNQTGLKYSSGIRDIAGKVDFQYQPSPIHDIKFGTSFIRHRFNPGAFAYNSNFEPDTTLQSNPVYANEYFIYIEDDLKINRQLNLNLGIHHSGFSVNNKIYKSLEPRVAFRYLFSNDISLKGSYTLMSQYINLLTNSGLGLPTDLWVPSTDRVRPQKATQYAFGLAKSFSKFEFTVEGYYKKMNNLIEYREGATYVSVNNEWEDKIAIGNGTSYGAELFFQKKYGKWNGWLGYTLSWNTRKFEELNFGKEYPYKYDRRHDVNIVFIYTPKKGVEYSLNWVYGTGNSITLPTNKYISIDNPEGFPHYDIEYFGERNGYRMDAYHRLDLSASWSKPKNWGERTWSFGLYNTYSRRNPFYVEINNKTVYDPETDSYFQEPRFEQINLFPILPAITYSFKFDRK